MPPCVEIHLQGFDSGLLFVQVEGLEARVGRRGHIKVRGGLPVTPSSTSASPAAPPVEPSGTDRGAAPEGINIAVQGLELRVRNVYTGQQNIPKVFLECLCVSLSLCQ
jgi:hypothetical protein